MLLPRLGRRLQRRQGGPPAAGGVRRGPAQVAGELDGDLPAWVGPPMQGQFPAALEDHVVGEQGVGLHVALGDGAAGGNERRMHR